MQSAFTFPSMGTQEPGMGSELYDESTVFRTHFDRLDEQTEIDLHGLCFDCSPEELAAPRNAEPAIVAVSYCFAMVAEENGYTPDYVVGLSLGQFAALAFADAIDPAAVVSIVRRRGELVEELSEDNGTMTLVVTDSIDRLADHVDAFSSLAIGVYGSDQAGVVSGDGDELDDLLAELEATAPFVETIPVPSVTEGFHSPLMEPVVPEFRAILDEYEFHDEVRYPIVSDITGEVRTDTAGLREELTDSLVAPARIDGFLETMRNEGVETYVEMLPEGRLADPIAELHPSADVIKPTHVVGRDRHPSG